MLPGHSRAVRRDKAQWVRPAPQVALALAARRSALVGSPERLERLPYQPSGPRQRQGSPSPVQARTESCGSRTSHPPSGSPAASIDGREESPLIKIKESRISNDRDVG